MSDIDSDFDSEPEIPSDDEITIVLNIHMPQEGKSSFDASMRPKIVRSKLNDQFHPTNPIWLGKKFVPVVPQDDDPKPWREFPATMNEYFNYGFTELVWIAYKHKQQELRKIYGEKEKPTGRRHQSKKDLH